MSAHIVAKELPTGKRIYRVHCETHDYWSPWLSVFENAIDLDRAHAVIAHGKKARPTHHALFDSNGESRVRSSVA